MDRADVSALTVWHSVPLLMGVERKWGREGPQAA